MTASDWRGLNEGGGSMPPPAAILKYSRIMEGLRNGREWNRDNRISGMVRNRKGRKQCEGRFWVERERGIHKIGIVGYETSYGGIWRKL